MLPRAEMEEMIERVAAEHRARTDAVRVVLADVLPAILGFAPSERYLDLLMFHIPMFERPNREYDESDFVRAC